MVTIHCDQLGTLELTNELGRGGMASVWRARAVSSDKSFAVKLLAPYLADISDARARFHREAEILARIDDASIVKLRARGETEGGIPFVVMDTVRGESLDKMLKREKRLSMTDTVSLLRQLLRALDVAHKAGVAHRDVKPGNIIVERTSEGLRATLIDFGVAHASWDIAMTDADKTVGTAHYMSPEQAFQPEIAGVGCDLWAAGVVAYECLHGVLPFEGDTFASVCVALHKGDYKAPSSVDPTFGVVIDAFFAKAFARKLEDRFQSASDMRDTMGALLVESGTFFLGHAPLLSGPVRNFATLSSAAAEVLHTPVETLFERFSTRVASWFASLAHRSPAKPPALARGH